MMIRQLIIAIFAIGALFWGVASHQQHCDIVAMFGVRKCPPHIIHLVIGFVFYGAMVYTAQEKFLGSLREMVWSVCKSCRM